MTICLKDYELLKPIFKEHNLFENDVDDIAKILGGETVRLCGGGGGFIFICTSYGVDYTLPESCIENKVDANKADFGQFMEPHNNC